MANDAHQLDAKNARISELEGSNSKLETRLSDTLANLERYILYPKPHIDALICEGKEHVHVQTRVGMSTKAMYC